MSFIPLDKIKISNADSPSIDAFGRARVSQLTTQIDIKQVQNNAPLLIDRVTNGTGADSYNSVNSMSEMTTSASGDWVVAQTLQRFAYQTGKSQLILMTFDRFEVETNITKQVGYYSSSILTPFNTNYDGIFLKSETNISINLGKSGSVTSVNQSAWNVDKLDGTGVSGITVDWSKSQILAIDFEWLGVGRVRCGLVIDGMVFYFHEFLNANNTNGVYMKSPNQPLRWEIRQNGAGSGQFNYICSTVASEGAINEIGLKFSENLGISFVNANSTANEYALLGIKLNSAKLDTLVNLLSISVMSATNDDVLWTVRLNPTVAGSFTYNSVSNSACDIAKGATGGTNTVTGGTLLDSGYLQSENAIQLAIENAIRLGAKIDGTLDKIVFSCRPLSAGLDVYGSLTWRELI